MFGFLKNASEQVALMGANDALREVMLFIHENPNSLSQIQQMSVFTIDLVLSNFNMKLSSDFIDKTYDPNFHRVAFEMKQRGKQYSKNSEEGVSALFLVAFFSILGVNPETKMRKMIVAQIKELLGYS